VRVSKVLRAILGLGREVVITSVEVETEGRHGCESRYVRRCSSGHPRHGRSASSRRQQWESHGAPVNDFPPAGVSLGRPGADGHLYPRPIRRLLDTSE
jgi:hypothetical protein